MATRIFIALVIALGLTAQAGAQVLQVEQSFRDWSITNISGIAFSSDSQHLYYLTATGLVHLQRDPGTGEQTFVKNYEPDYDELEGVHFSSNTLITLSPDEKHLYVGEDLKVNDEPDGLVDPERVTDGVIFERDLSDGSLTYVGPLDTTGDDGRLYDYDFLFLGSGSRGIVISNSHRFDPYYFERDTSSGAITVTGPMPLNNTKESSTRWMKFYPSPDGQDIYRTYNNGIDHYRTETDSNDYAYVATYFSPADNLELEGDSLFGAYDMAVSPNGEFAYATSYESYNPVVIFSRDTTTGALTFVDTSSYWAEGLWMAPTGDRILTCGYGGAVLMSVDTDTGELWGNFPQTYCMVGIINSAALLSRPWSQAM